MNTIAQYIDSLEPRLVATLWTVAIAMAATTSCALVGCYLVLRRMGLLGDAISHAVLPGLVVGFVLSGTRSMWPMMIGATAAGLLTTFLSDVLRRRARLEASAGLGVVFTSLFALGVLLINLYGSKVDLDPGCVLLGALESAALNTTPVGGIEIPRAFITLAIVAACNLAFVALLWKELKITSFDAALAATLGIPAVLIHYLLMAAVACTTVACFEAVGSILVIAMLIVPGATAHLLTNRLRPMLVVAVAVGWISAAGGVYLAKIFNTSEAGMMTVANGAVFTLAVLFAPQHGVLARWARNLGLALRIVEEDILARLYRIEERGAALPAGGSVAAAALLGRMDAGEPEPARGTGRLALMRLRMTGALERAGGDYCLTARGRRRAQSLVRSHRAWERYLAEGLGLPADHLHAPAHRMEHFVSDELADDILKRATDPSQDPHGRAIPPAP